MKGKIGAIGLGVVMVTALIILAMCTKKVDAGYKGIVYNVRSGVSGETLSQGWHIVSPGKKVIKYSIGIEQSYLTSKDQGDSKGDDSFEVPTSDGKGLTVDLTFTYRFNEEQITEVFTKFKGKSGSEVLTSFIKPNVISWTKEVTAKYPVTEILGDKRASLNEILTSYLKEKFVPYGIIIENVSLIDINPDEKTRNAIQEKITAQQQMELAEVQAKTAKIEAEKDKEVAQIQAEQAKIKAQGEAEAKKIAAEAEAEANKKISNSLTNKLIEKIKYEKWNGELSKYAGGNGGIIINESGGDKSED